MRIKRATDREKTVLFALAAGYLDTWEKAFILSRQESEESAAALKSLKSSVTHWKQHPEIIQAYQAAKDILKGRDERNAAKILQAAPAVEETKTDKDTAGDSERPDKAKKSPVDYYSPDAQRRTINAIIDRSQDDPRTQLDAIKTIQQTQRDDRQAAKDNQIQRFYTPVTCYQCPLYQKRKK